MDTFLANTNVTVTIPFVDQNGATFAPTSASYRVLDESDALIQDVTPLTLPDPPGSSVNITVEAVYNDLPPPSLPDMGMTGDLRVHSVAARQVELTMTNASGSAIVSVLYVIRAPNRLTLMQNTFQTYNQALLTAIGMPNLAAWSIAAQADQEMALIEAWNKLTLLGYYVRWPRDPDAQNYLDWSQDDLNAAISPRLWTVMTVDRWMTYYPEVFRVALRKAQVAQANDVLTASQATSKRNDGIIAETIGESSIRFRTSKPLDLRVCKPALDYLTGYVDFQFVVRRA